MSDHISFQRPPSSFHRYDRAEQHQGAAPHSTQQQYHGTWETPSFHSTTSLSSHDWTWPYEASIPSTGSIQATQAATEPLLDLGPLSENQDAANGVDVQSLLKPATAEAWQPPFLSRHGSISHGYHSSGYARSTGVMTEPLRDEETYSFVGSECSPTFDSSFYPMETCHNTLSFRQDVIRDDRSEVSAISGAHPTPSPARPPAGRISSDSRVIANNGRRRRSSQPLPACEYCKTFYPKNHSDKMYVPCPCSHHYTIANDAQQARKKAHKTVQVPSRRMQGQRRRLLN